MIEYVRSQAAAMETDCLREAALYCDVDGTLVSTDNHLAPSMIREIRAFVDTGFDFTLATGRNLAAVQRFLPQLPITAPLVLCNGAYVFDTVRDEAVYTAIDPEILAAILSLLLKLTGVIVYIDTVEGKFWVSSEQVLSDPYVLVEGLRPQVFRQMDEVIGHYEVIKLGVKVTAPDCISSENSEHPCYTDFPPKVQETVDYIRAEYQGMLEICSSSEHFVEFMAGGVSKWYGIQVSQHMKSRKSDTIMAVGDHFNDIAMIRNADIGIAMENAVPEVKQHADYCIGHVDDLALANFIRFLRSSTVLPTIERF